ncbi:MAG: hypothetical protein IH998_07515, partial [Proteobacteria bacterium]|nr:hypothetical protein [Pseudomonadota bacterium]
MVVTVVVVLAAAIGYRLMPHSTPDDPAIVSPVPQIRTLVVLPLVNTSKNPEEEYFADGMTDALISDLSRISALNVIPRSVAMTYKDSDLSL